MHIHSLEGVFNLHGLPYAPLCLPTQTRARVSRLVAPVVCNNIHQLSLFCVLVALYSAADLATLLQLAVTSLRTMSRYERCRLFFVCCWVPRF